MTVPTDTLHPATPSPKQHQQQQYPPTVTNTNPSYFRPPSQMQPTDPQHHHLKGSHPHQAPHSQPRPRSSSLLSSWLTGSSSNPSAYSSHSHPHPQYHPGPANPIDPRYDRNLPPPPNSHLATGLLSGPLPVQISQWSDPRFHRDHPPMGSYAQDYGRRGDERMDDDRAPHPHPHLHSHSSHPPRYQHFPPQRRFPAASPIDTTTPGPYPLPPQGWTFSEIPVKRKGIKPKAAKSDEDEDTTGSSP